MTSTRLAVVGASSAPDPYPFYAELVAERPLYFDDDAGCWVASGAAAVDAVLTHPAARVRPPTAPVPPGLVGTAAGEVFGALVRMTDGPAHDQRRPAVAAALARATRDDVAAAARAAVGAGSEAGTAINGLQFGAPAHAVALLAGLNAADAAAAARHTGAFVQCLPPTATTEQLAAASEAAAALRELLGPPFAAGAPGLLGSLRYASDRPDPALLDNGVGLLSQTYDATAALVGNTLVALRREGVPAREALDVFVREVARHDSPVHNTRRFFSVPVTVAAATIEPGQSVLAVVAAANRDPAVNPDPHRFDPRRREPVLFTFGRGPHACPGQTLALTLGTEIVAAALDHGLDPQALPAPAGYRPLANVRIPEFPAPGEEMTRS